MATFNWMDDPGIPRDVRYRLMTRQGTDEDYDLRDLRERLHRLEAEMEEQQARWRLRKNGNTSANRNPAIAPRIKPGAAGTASPDSPASFPKFTQLPPELRLRIWKYALPGPATIKRDCPSTNRFVAGPARRRVPAVLQVCRESRKAFLASPDKHDQHGTKYQLVDFNGDGRSIYVDWHTDDISVCGNFYRNDLKLVDLSNIRFLTVYLDPILTHSGYIQLHGISRFTPRFPSLELLTIAIQASTRGWVFCAEDFPDRDTWEPRHRVPVFWEYDQVKTLVEEAIEKENRRDFYSLLQQQPEWDVPKWRVILVD